MSLERKQNRICFLLIPIIGILILFRILPIFLAFLMSFYNWGVYRSVFIGLDNYSYFFRDKTAVRSLTNTFRYVLMYVPINIILALLIAIMVNQSSVLFRSFFRMMFFLPLVMSLVAVSILWQIMYQPQFGLFSSITRALGFGAPLWLQSSKTAMACIVAMDIWKSVGYNMIIFMAGLTNIPASLYEAAEVDGANGHQKFTSITIPLLQPTTLFIMVVTIIGALQIFTQVHIMTQGGPENSTRVFVQYLRDTSFLNLELGYGAALSFILFLIVLMLTAVQFRLLRTKWEY